MTTPGNNPDDEVVEIIAKCGVCGGTRWQFSIMILFIAVPSVHRIALRSNHDLVGSKRIHLRSQDMDPAMTSIMALVRTTHQLHHPARPVL